jgi:hypothetical protein
MRRGTPSKLSGYLRDRVTKTHRIAAVHILKEIIDLLRLLIACPFFSEKTGIGEIFRMYIPISQRIWGRSLFQSRNGHFPLVIALIHVQGQTLSWHYTGECEFFFSI